MANFFIDRPIFAWVLAILLCLTGASWRLLHFPLSNTPIWHRRTCASPQTIPALPRKRWKTP